MKLKKSPIALLALTIASCASPPQLPVAETPAAPQAQQPQASVSMSDSAPESASARLEAEDAFQLKAEGPVVLKNATAVGTNAGSSANNAIDGNTATKWQISRAARTATLTAEIDRPTALPLLTVTLNSDAFTRGNTFDVQTSSDGLTFTTVLANRTKPAAGSVTLAIPAVAAATAKFVRIRCNNRAPGFTRTPFGITELSVTADIPAPPPPPDDDGGTGGDDGISGNFAFQNMSAAVVQYRPGRGRMRFEAVGAATDPATAALNDLAAEALAAAPTHRYRGRGQVFRSGPTDVNGVPTNGASIGSADVFMIQPADELGVIVETDLNTGNLVEIIWPAITEGLPDDPIVRVEVANAPFGLDGTNVNVEFTVDKVDENDIVIASWTGRSVNVTVPAPRP
jgi:hypothetical protein